MRIAGYLQTSLIEWPGKVVSVIFVPGCNFRCPFCYNRDLVLDSNKLPKISEKEVLKDLEKRKKWVDGVVVTGGEPTLQKNLLDFLMKLKKQEFLTRIYTNGSNPSGLKALLTKKLLDAITMDIKGPLDKRYFKSAGVSVDLEKIKQSIRLVVNSKIEFQLVTTVVPKLHQRKNLVDLAKELTKLTQRAGKEKKLSWALHQFWPKDTCLNPEFGKIKPYNESKMEKFLEEVGKIFPEVELKI